MKTLSSPGAIRAFTLVELLVVIVIIVIFFALLRPAVSRPQRALNMACLSNLRQNDLGFILWASDNQDRFPWQVSATNGGTMESIPGGHVFPHFQTLSNFVKSMQVLVCPTDKVKQVATNYAELSDRNISYFINLDVSTNTGPAVTILAGDRHLQANGQGVKPGLFIFTPNLSMGWTLELHNKTKTAPAGVLAFADGHAEVTVTKSLPAIFQRLGLATNRLMVP
jgi:prepilin-type N-terminal cleavage/methylation domain-containing protein